MFRNRFFFCLVAVAASGGLSAKEMSRQEATERLELMEKTKHIAVKAEQFVKDDDYYTVQFVLAKEGDEEPSNVSADGQVVFLNARTATDPSELIEQSVSRRLANKPAK